MIKYLSIVIGVIIVIFSSGYESEYLDKTSDVEYKENTAQEVQLVENTIADNEIVENIASIEESFVEEENKSIKIIMQEDTKVIKKQEPVKSEKQVRKEIDDTNVNNSKGQEVKVLQTEEMNEIQTQIIVETPKEEPKNEKPQQKEITADDLEYWCIAGGNHHVAGDNENEHGYYSSWDEAYNAFLNYTVDWSSTQYKVSECSCGLYYFWAIK